MWMMLLRCVFSYMVFVLDDERIVFSFILCFLLHLRASSVHDWLSLSCRKV